MECILYKDVIMLPTRETHIIRVWKIGIIKPFMQKGYRSTDQNFSFFFSSSSYKT